MSFKRLSLMALLSILFVGLNGVALGREAPVAKLVDILGSVEYSRDGTEWKPVKIGRAHV